MANADNTIQEHSLFDNMIKLADKLYVNTMISGNANKQLLAQATVAVVKIYQATKDFPRTQAIIGHRGEQTNFIVNGLGYLVFDGDDVLVTVSVSLG